MDIKPSFLGKVSDIITTTAKKEVYKLPDIQPDEFIPSTKRAIKNLGKNKTAEVVTDARTNAVKEVKLQDKTHILERDNAGKITKQTIKKANGDVIESVYKLENDAKVIERSINGKLAERISVAPPPRDVRKFVRYGDRIVGSSLAPDREIKFAKTVTKFDKHGNIASEDVFLGKTKVTEKIRNYSNNLVETHYDYRDGKIISTVETLDSGATRTEMYDYNAKGGIGPARITVQNKNGKLISDSEVSRYGRGDGSYVQCDAFYDSNGEVSHVLMTEAAKEPGMVKRENILYMNGTPLPSKVEIVSDRERLMNIKYGSFDHQGWH